MIITKKTHILYSIYFIFYYIYNYVRVFIATDMNTDKVCQTAWPVTWKHLSLYLSEDTSTSPTCIGHTPWATNCGVFSVITTSNTIWLIPLMPFRYRFVLRSKTNATCLKRHLNRIPDIYRFNLIRLDDNLLNEICHKIT